MVLNYVKLGGVVSVMKYFANVVSLILLPKILIWKKMVFPVSNSLKLAELKKTISKLFTNIFF